MPIVWMLYIAYNDKEHILYNKCAIFRLKFGCTVFAQERETSQRNLIYD